MSHLKKHALTGTTDHDLTGLLPLQILGLNSSSSSVVSTGIYASGGTLTASTYYSGATPLTSIFALESQLSQFIPLTGTTAPNIVTGNIEFASTNGIEWNGGSESIVYNTSTGNIDMNATNGFDFTNGPILSAGTPLSQIIASAITGIWSSSTGANSIIASNGTGNLAYGAYSIVGGKSNSAITSYSFIGGGSGNTTSGTFSTIGGGRDNVASGRYSFIGGGGGYNSYNYGNIASGAWSVIAGGRLNTATTFFTSVLGGLFNIASYNYAVVTGGRANKAYAKYSSIVGGKNNTISGQYSTVVGGTNNLLSSAATNSFILGSSISGVSANTTYIENARLAETTGSVIYSAGTPLESIFLTTTSISGTTHKYSTTLTTPSASTINTITHNLGTTDIGVSLWLITTGDLTNAKVTNRTTNTVDVIFSSAPGENIRVVVQG